MQNAYDSIAQEFSHTRFLVWPELSVFIPYFPQGGKILDLGCGKGRLIKVLQASGKKYEYLGIDFSEKLLAKARQQFPDHIFQMADMTKLDLPVESFDAICLVASFHHLRSKQERQALLDRIYRWLKPGGILFMTNWHLWQPKYRKYFFKNIKDKKSWNDCFIPYKLPNSQKFYWRYYHSFTKRELEGLLTKSGFVLKPKGVYRTKYNTNCLVSRR